MKIVVVGASGTIGAAVAAALEPRHEVVRVSRRGPVQADLENAASLVKLFGSIQDVDAVVACAGTAAYKPLAELSQEDFELGLRSKLMGQVNLTRFALKYLKDRGSVTLTSGILSQQPQPGSAAYSLVNAGVEAFARAAALEAPRGIRVNVVSPPWMSETLKAMGQDPGGGIPAAACAKAYVDAVEGAHRGAVLDARRYA